MAPPLAGSGEVDDRETLDLVERYFLLQIRRNRLINDLVGEKYLLNAISLNSAAVNLSRSLGPGICGLLISAWGVDISYYVQAGMYAFASLWTVQISAPRLVTKIADTTAEIPQSFLSSAAEGIRYILKNRLILALMILGLAPILLGMPFMSVTVGSFLGLYEGSTFSIMRYLVAVIAAVLVTAVGATAYAFSIQVWAQQFASPSHVAILFSLEPVFAALTSVLFYGEHLTGRTIAGAALVLAGIVIAELKGPAPAAPEAATTG